MDSHKDNFIEAIIKSINDNLNMKVSKEKKDSLFDSKFHKDFILGEEATQKLAGITSSLSDDMLREELEQKKEKTMTEMLQERIDALEKTNKELSYELEIEGQKNNDLQDYIDELESDVDYYEEVNCQLRYRNDELADTDEEQKKLIEKYEQDLIKLEDTVDSQKSAITDLEKANNTLQETIISQKEIIDKLEKSLKEGKVKEESSNSNEKNDTDFLIPSLLADFIMFL